MYCGIGKLPKGHRPGTDAECLNKKQVRLYGLNAIDPYLISRQKRLPPPLDMIELGIHYMFCRVRRLKLTVQVLEKSLSPEGLNEFQPSKASVTGKRKDLAKAKKEINQKIKEIGEWRVKLRDARVQWAQIEAEDKARVKRKEQMAKRKEQDEIAEVKRKKRKQINGVDYFTI